MSLYDYRESRDILMQGYPFYALIMAAIRQADSMNRERLRLAFPDVYREFEQRSLAPGGRLPQEVTT